jgi:riboflavin kinase/FMN adenylyltransferase
MTERGSLVAIGNFDGVHLGHQAVLEASAEEAHRKQVLALALTFHPHPAVVLGRPHTVLTEISRKVELICRIDPELQVVVQPFTTELAAKSPREFVVELLLAKLHAKLVVVGENFRFGHARAGNLSLLSELGRELGFETRAQTLSQDETVGVYSSSRAREAISAGDLARAEAILGRPHSVSGIVILGDQRGRRLGVPTANLSGVSEVLPPFGAYACVVDRVSKDGVAQALGKAMLNIGIRPTAKAGYSIEAHIFDFQGELYGARLRVHFISRLREEMRFAGLEELKGQLARDAQRALGMLQGREPDPRAGGAWY